jgi:transcriptional regulator with XRE-family HTH domain
MIALSRYLREKGISVAQFATLIGRSRMQVYRYLSGDDLPRKDTLEAIMRVTGGAVTAESFYGAPKRRVA